MAQLPEQQKQLETWAEQRDALLASIAALKSENELLEKKNSGLALSNVEIENRMREAVGKISGIKEMDAELSQKVSKEVVELTKNRSILEVEVSNFKKEVFELCQRKADLTADVLFLTDIFNKITGKAELLDKVVAHVTDVSKNNVVSIEGVAKEISRLFSEIISKSEETVVKANQVISELPRLLVEAKRQVIGKIPLNKHK
jgi:chromosome segregation ATPase